MKTLIFCALTALAVATGCTETRKSMGAANENDRNVLTGGPVTGTKLSDLPDSVRQNLHNNFPTAEVADIDKQTLNGQTLYKISFAEPGKNPTVYISEDGKTVPNPNHKAPGSE